MGMAIDVKHRRPYLSTITGGLSGAAVKPVAVRMVWQVAHSVNVPVIGLGGIMNTDDALEFIMAGATAIQVGTANFINPNIGVEIAEGLDRYCKENNLENICEIRGII